MTYLNQIPSGKYKWVIPPSPIDFDPMAKTTCGESRRLSIFWFKKEGYLRGWYSGTINWHVDGEPRGSIGISVDTTASLPFVRLQFTSTDWDGIQVHNDYRIQLTTTRCNFSGKRYWFICPLIKNGRPCERKAGILYGYNNLFGCRVCLDLAYSSQQETHDGGFFGTYGACIRLEETLEKQEKRLRVKFWKGKPTKRYASWLKKAERLEAMNRMDLEIQLGRRL